MVQTLKSRQIGFPCCKDFRLVHSAKHTVCHSTFVTIAGIQLSHSYTILITWPQATKPWHNMFHLKSPFNSHECHASPDHSRKYTSDASPTKGNSTIWQKVDSRDLMIPKSTVLVCNPKQNKDTESDQYIIENACYTWLHEKKSQVCRS
jgi:hypothetical protein